MSRADPDRAVLLLLMPGISVSSSVHNSMSTIPLSSLTEKSTNFLRGLYDYFTKISPRAITNF